ncbi:MAG: 2OG-Fe(II) oxygenase [Methylococcales bacterium]|nr:2OG-Fe(II) oxygenase [Methylococcales bacterium]MDD5214992.1 2OG-Fe(II) oxygenase [Methylococcales bacterium]
MTQNSELSLAWQEWIISNLQRGCSVQSMVEAMVNAQFEATFATQCIEKFMNVDVASLPTTKTDEPYRYESSRIARGNFIELADKTVHVALRLNRPEVVLFTHFMSDEECDALIAHAKEKTLSPSTVVDPKSGKGEVINARSSEGTFFQRGENALIQSLEKRISQLMNCPVENGEGIQVLHYLSGAEYRPHFDYFPANQIGSATHLKSGGQRTATLVMYLNDVENGGETFFPEANLSVTPKKGSAVYFSYFNSLGQTDSATLHAGNPVLAGEKWIATKWVRQNKYG